MTTITADAHQLIGAPNIARAITLLADVYEPARTWAAEKGNPDWGRDPHFTIGYLVGTIETLLDALGHPVQGPHVDQWAWVDPDDEDDDR